MDKTPFLQSLLAILPIIQGKTGYFLKKLYPKFKSPFKGPLFYLAVFLFIFLAGTLILAGDYKLDPISIKPSFLAATLSDKLPAQDLFVEPAKNFLGESPEMAFIQKNSIVGISSPVVITSQSLGTILEDGEIEPRKEILEYTVKSGDTLSSITEEFNISLETILWANDLNKNSKIKLGQKLVILPVSGVLYVVEKGDTLSGIAEIYKGKVEEIVAFNELSSEGDIYIGDILIIPNGKMPSQVPQTFSIPLADSYFIFPCEGKITQGLHLSNAIDIANQCGKPVVAVASGIVQRAGFSKISGDRVTILHTNGVVTYYGHLSIILVKPDQIVNTGEIIGYIGNTGYTKGATGCHLHFGVGGAKNFLGSYLIGSYLSWSK